MFQQCWIIFITLFINSVAPYPGQVPVQVDPKAAYTQSRPTDIDLPIMSNFDTMPSNLDSGTFKFENVIYFIKASFEYCSFLVQNNNIFVNTSYYFKIRHSCRLLVQWIPTLLGDIHLTKS